MKQYTYLHTDHLDNQHLIRFEYADGEIIINEVSLVYDGAVLGDSPTVSFSSAQQIILESDQNEWEQYRNSPTPKYPSAETVAAIKEAHDRAKSDLAQIESMQHWNDETAADLLAATLTYKTALKAWERVGGLWNEYYMQGHYEIDPAIESLTKPM